MAQRKLSGLWGVIVVFGVPYALIGCSSGDRTKAKEPTVIEQARVESQETLLDRSAVHFGMTRQEALGSSWGAPLAEEDIGTGQSGIAVLRLSYPHDQYLYFEADRLVGVMQSGIVERETTDVDEKRRKLDEKLEEKAVARFKREDVARRRQEGVRIGMTEDDVLKSSWGRPRKINRTITTQGVREQWVYASGYLYFEDGSLTAIQD